MTNAEDLYRRSVMPDHMTECECGAWVPILDAYHCDDGPTLCLSCRPTAADIAAQQADKARTAVRREKGGDA